MEKNNIIQAILEKTSLVKLISDYTSLQKKGNNYLGLCPFHNEKTPSFSVIEEKRFYHCFGCKESGNALNFLMKIESISFKDALQKLAQNAGITIDKNFEKKLEKEGHLKSLLQEINNKTALIYQQNLLENTESQAMYYLKNRKITPSIIQRFLLGFSPVQAQFLVAKIKNLFPHSLSLSQVLATGLFFPAKDVSPPLKDRFRNKIIFPIQNEKNEVIGFGSRVLDDSLPKYINSSETLLFKKKEILYGFNFAKESIKKNENIFITEGYFDVIAMHQFGFTNTVATLGTAFTLFHLEKILPYTNNITFLFDGDTAGLKAANKALQICLSTEIEPLIVLLPDKMDPYDYLFSFGAESFEEFLTKNSFSWKEFLSKPIVDEKNPLKRQKLMKETLQLLREINPFLEKDFILLVCDVLEIDTNAFQGFLENKSQKFLETHTATPGNKENQISITVGTHKRDLSSFSLKQAEETMVVLFCYDPILFEKYKEMISATFFMTPKAKQIFTLFEERIQDMNLSFEILAFIESLPDELKLVFTKMMDSIDDFTTNGEKQAKDIYYSLRIAFLQEKITETIQLIEEEEEKPSKDTVYRFMQELQALKLEKQKLEKLRVRHFN